jgi:hypothetical protein
MARILHKWFFNQTSPLALWPAMDKIRLFCMLFIRVRKEEEDAVVRKVIA